MFVEPGLKPTPGLALRQKPAFPISLPNLKHHLPVSESQRLYQQFAFVVHFKVFKTQNPTEYI